MRSINRAEVLHFLGPPGIGKSHLTTAIEVAAVKAGRSVYRCSLAELIGKRCSGSTLPVPRAVVEVRGWTRPALRPHWTPTLECL
ncbi:MULTISPECIES: ATP-binding protein [unclassified Novosphingobium]|nr:MULTISPECIES: ATP-binding protein [unclassified Novosphingobium]